MKIAVIGGGTAGYLACVHITKEFPDFDLYHIYDPNIPTIGVGEGTTPDFVGWLHKMTGLSFSTLQARCNITKKYGIKFENWGRTHNSFMHNFYPIGENYAYHLSANKLIGVLQEHVEATHIGKKVVQLESSWESAQITFADGEQLNADFVFDARGFPKEFDEQAHIKLSFVPTNAAFIRSGPPVNFCNFTRAVARPHGWIFIIPLTNRTSYGYIYNRHITEIRDIEQDLDVFLKENNVNLGSHDSGKVLTFPNIAQRTFFDGTVFRLGNAASFVEPLEATSIHYTLTQIKTASHWPLSGWHLTQKKGQKDVHNINTVNRFLTNYVHRIALFIGWHYAEGASFDTDFWRYAQSNFQEALTGLDSPEIIQDFEQFLEALSVFPNSITESDLFSRTIKGIYAAKPKDRLPGELTKFPRVSISRFALFPDISFAEIGHGIDYRMASPV